MRNRRVNKKRNVNREINRRMIEEEWDRDRKSEGKRDWVRKQDVTEQVTWKNQVYYWLY